MRALKTNYFRRSNLLLGPSVYIAISIASTLVQPLVAASLAWDPAINLSNSGGTGTWNTTLGNWNNAGTDAAWVNANNVNDTAVFGGTGGTVTLGAAITAGGVSFAVSGYTLSGTSNLTLSGSGSSGINVNSGVTGTQISLTGGSGFILLKTGGSATAQFVNTDLINFNSTVVEFEGTTNLAVTNSAANGITTLQTVTATRSAGFTATGFLSGSGNVTINSFAAAANNATPTVSTNANPNAFTYSGTGLLTINGNNTLFNNTNVGGSETFRLTSGTLALGNDNALGALNAGSTATGTIFQLNGGTVQGTATRSIANNTNLTATSTIGGTNNLTLSGTFANSGASSTLTNTNTGITTLSGNVYLSNNSTGRTMTIANNSATGMVISGVVANDSTNASASGFTAAGTGKVTLTNTSTYTGATIVNGGTLTLGNGGNLGATAAAVNTGGTFSISQNANASSNALTGSLTLNAGSAFSMNDGFTSTFNVTGASTLAPTSGTSPTLVFNIGGATTTTDLLAIGGAATVGAGKATISVVSIGATPLTPGNYNLITAASGLGTSNLTLGGATNVVIGGSLFHYSLGNSTTTAEILSVLSGATSATSAYWTGGQSSSWTTQTGGTFNTNFAADAAGTSNTLALPDLNTNVTFTANSASNLSTTLDQNFTINSLAFSGSGTSNSAGTTIATGSGTNILSINAAALNGNVAGNGITVAAGSGANTISANVALGGAQSWTNNSGSLLTVSGDVGNGANLLTIAGTGNTTISGVIGNGGGGLTKSGAGTLTLSNANNSYGGVTTITGGTLSVSALANGGSSSGIGSSSNSAANLLINTGGTLQYTGGSVSTDRSATIGSGGGGINVSDAATTLTFAGVTLGGNFLTKSGPGSLTVGDVSGSAGATIGVTGGVATLQGSADNPYLAASVTSGTLVLAKASTFSAHSLGGNSTISGGILKLAGTGGDQIYDNATLAINGGGTLDMGGVSEKVRSISGSGSIINSGGSQSTLTVSGFSGSTVFNGVISGNIALTHSDASSSTTLNGLNTYSGNTNIQNSSATFNLGSIGGMTFYPTANGVTNSVTGTVGATANFDGLFAFDLTNAAALNGNFWDIVNVATLTENFSATFSVQGFSENTNVWTKPDGGSQWAFSESTGRLSYSAVPEPSSWCLSSLLVMSGLLRRRRL